MPNITPAFHKAQFTITNTDNQNDYAELLMDGKYQAGWSPLTRMIDGERYTGSLSRIEELFNRAYADAYLSVFGQLPEIMKGRPVSIFRFDDPYYLLVNKAAVDAGLSSVATGIITSMYKYVLRNAEAAVKQAAFNALKDTDYYKNVETEIKSCSK